MAKKSKKTYSFTVEGHYLYRLGTTKQTKPYKLQLTMPSTDNKMHSYLKKTLVPKQLGETVEDFTALRTCFITDVQETGVEKPDLSTLDAEDQIEYMNRTELVDFCLSHGLIIDPMRYGNIVGIREMVTKEFERKVEGGYGEKDERKAKKLKRDYKEKAELNEIMQMNAGSAVIKENPQPKSQKTRGSLTT